MTIDRTAASPSAYATVRDLIASAYRRGASFAQLEEVLLDNDRGLRGDERSALWLYAWGLICKGSTVVE